MCKELGTKPNPKYLEARKEVKDAWASHEKLKKYFDYEPRYTLKDGIHKMAAWAKNVDSRSSITFRNIEIEENLSPSWKT